MIFNSNLVKSERLDAEYLKAPFPYFGGKSTVADKIWAALGSPKHYIEPFFGSGAVLLNRPAFETSSCFESINDKDGFVANVWRSLQYDPDAVAQYADSPVNHADLSARRRYLIGQEPRLLEALSTDPDFFDAKCAGWWIWAASCWIGSGLTCLNAIPHISNGGKGVHAIGTRPHITNGGMGVHAIGTRPHLDGGMGLDVREPYNTNIYQWFRQLSERLRYVRVVCGDWTRICGGDWQDNKGVCGIYFDPPYAVNHRDKNLYHHDSTEVGKDVEKWCLERGRRETYRIVVSGYEGEYESLLAAGWTFESWEANGGYAHIGDGQGKKNKKLERLFYSPHCVKQEQMGIW